MADFREPAGDMAGAGMPKTSTKPVRRARNADITRIAIRAAARIHFARENYDRVGLREVAADAGVDAALVARYFGSKEALLEEVLSEALYPSVLFDGDRATFGERLLSAFADGQPHQKERDFFMLLLRVAMIPALQPMLQRLIDDRLMLPFAAWLGGPQTALRSKLIHTLLTGASMQTVLVGPSPLSPADTDQFRKLLGSAIQHLVDGSDLEAALSLLVGRPTLGRPNGLHVANEPVSAEEPTTAVAGKLASLRQDRARPRRKPVKSS